MNINLLNFLEEYYSILRNIQNEFLNKEITSDILDNINILLRLRVSNIFDLPMIEKSDLYFEYVDQSNELKLNDSEFLKKFDVILKINKP